MLSEDPTRLYSIHGHPIEKGKIFPLGELRVSADEIIAFARVVDPLPFHIDEDAAAKSHFGTLVASGPMMYSEYHKRAFIPLFGPSIMAGRGIEKWMFYKPHYPEISYFGQLEILNMEVHVNHGTVSLLWHFKFRDISEELVQELKVGIIHKLDT